MNKELLASVAAQMVAPGKGILAADESHSTCKKRFDSIGVEFTEENRRQYRQILTCTPGLEEHVSGVILFDETLRQKADNGSSFVEVMRSRGILPGIKVDTGAKDMALHPGEKVTEGLDGLRDRLKAYKQEGAAFAKWRAVITIDEEKGLPTPANLAANAHALARYAALCQENDIVPIVEPEVLINGPHSIDYCAEVTRDTLNELFSELEYQDVYLEGLILKASMVISGLENENRAGIQEVAEKTVEVLKECVPVALQGVVFLSGGQSEIESTAHLDAMNKIGNLPWALTFSYGRAIQQPVLSNWAKGNKEEAVKQLLHRSKMNGLAAKGEWSEGLEG